LIARDVAPDARDRLVRLLVQAALAAVVLATLAHTRADPDLWGHVAFGRDIVTTRALPASDTYSFTSDVPWVNHEWLAEVAMYAAYALGGGPALIALKILVVAVALLLAARTLRLEGVAPPARDLLLAVAVIASVQQANAVRPQVFSILLFAAMLSAMVGVERGRLRSIAWMPVILFLWVNLHGGWIVGAGTLALWATVRLLETPRGREPRIAFAVSALSAFATLANPYGWRMWEFLLTTVRPARVEISDWQPVYLMGPGVYLTWAALVLLMALALWRAKDRPPLPRLLIVVALAIGAFRVNRLLMFLAFSIAMLLGPQMRALVRKREAERAATGATASAIAAIAAVAILLGALAATATYGRCIIVESDRWPEPEAVNYIREHAPRGRMLSWFNWGEYALWYLAPGIQVSIDGRRETVYSPEVLARHLAFYYDGADARQYLDALRADYVWLPVSLPVVAVLESRERLPVVWRGPRSVLFATRPTDVRTGGPASPGDRPALARCFPGP
jgi:hypothetical protein